MKINYAQLEQQLPAKLSPIYVIAGDDVFLKQEAKQLISKVAKQAGYAERIVITPDTGFNWDELYTTLFSPSLFQNKCLIECNLSEMTISKIAGEILQTYAEKYSVQQIFIIELSKIDEKIAKTAWYKALDKIAPVVTIWPINREQMPAWILQRARRYSLSFNLATANFLSDLVEGNIAAAAQALEKIYLYQPSEKIDDHLISVIVHDQCHYSIFDFIDYLLLGKGQETLACLNHLRAEGTEPTLILWAITRELRLLANFYRTKSMGMTFEEICKKQRVFARHQQAIKKFLPQHQLSDCWNLLKHAAEIDKLLKGGAMGDPWQALALFCLRFQRSSH